MDKKDRSVYIKFWQSLFLDDSSMGKFLLVILEIYNFYNKHALVWKLGM